MKLTSILKALACLAALILIPIAAAGTGRYTETDANLVPKVEQRNDALDVYLSRLAWTYECVGKCSQAEKRHEPYRRVDSNGLYSYGCLQFQQATYLAYAKRYGLDPWSNGGIYSCQNQMTIARTMFLEDKEAAAGHWYTSIYTRGLGLPNI